MEQKKILLKAAGIITEKGEILKNMDIAVEKGKIRSVTAGGTEKEELFDQVVDCSSYYVTPGLTNLHCHCAMNFFKGLAEDVNSDAWFNDWIFPYESQLTEEDVYTGTKLGIAEMLNCGVTAFADHYFAEKAVAKAVLDMGIRADIAPTVFGMAPNFADRLDEVSDFCEKMRDKSDLLTVRMGPHAPYTCAPPTLKTIIDRAKELKLGIHLHVSETKAQLEQSLAAYGKTPFRMLYEAGGFDQQVIIGHGLWITEEDFAYLTDDTWFAECAKTYAKHAMGTGLVFKNRKRLNYSFGTDGAASSATLNPMEQARIFAMTGKIVSGDAEDYAALEMWQAAMNGHRAFAFHTGKIEAGYSADLVIWDLNRINTFPVYNPITAILYSSEPSNVRYTMVDGIFRKEDGVLCIDEDALVREGLEVQRSILTRGKGKAEVFY